MRCRCINNIYKFKRGEFYDYVIGGYDYVTIFDVDGIIWFFTEFGFKRHFVDMVELREGKLKDLLDRGSWLDVVVGRKWRKKIFNIPLDIKNKLNKYLKKEKEILFF